MTRIRLSDEIAGGEALPAPTLDSPRAARKGRRVVKDDGRVVRMVPVAPRCRFGADTEREFGEGDASPPLELRPYLTPIPEHIVIEVLPPGPDGLPKAKRRNKPRVRFDDSRAMSPRGPGLDPITTIVARRIDRWGMYTVDVLESAPRLRELALMLSRVACERLRSLTPPATVAVRAANALLRERPDWTQAMCAATQCVSRILHRLVDRGLAAYTTARAG